MITIYPMYPMYKLPLLLAVGSLFATPSIPRNFFQTKGEWSRFGKSTVYDPIVVGDRISADIITGSLHYNHLFNKKSGFRLGVGYDGLKIDWVDNPLTSQKLFSYAQASLGLFLINAKKWDIYSEFCASLDTNNREWSDYALYRLTLYTKYNFENRFNFHAGFSAYYGIRYNHVIPIIGVDFPLGRKFHLHAVFPHDLAFEYKPLSFLSALVRIRLIETPRRLSPTALRPKGTIEYKNTGAEFALKAHYNDIIGATGFIGHSITGHVKARNQDGSDLTYYRFRTAAYFGASIFAGF